MSLPQYCCHGRRSRARAPGGTLPMADVYRIGISGSYGGVNKTTKLTVTAQPLPTVSTLTLSPSTVTGGASSTGTVRLSGAAPSGGALVTLASSNTNVATVPQSVVVLAGQLTATFTVTTIAATSNRSAVISASYNSTTTSATISVKKRRN